MAPTSPDPGASDVPDELFKNVKYYIIGNIDAKVQELLDAGGARRDTYLSEMVSHAIAASLDEDEVSEAVDLFEVPVVTPQWVIMSVKCGILLPTNAFNLDTQQLFSKVVACKSKIGVDVENVWSVLTYYGARCQQRLDKTVTHLICTRPEGIKYEAAVRRDLKIVTPDWVFDSLRDKRLQDEAVYHPRLLIIIPKSPTPSSPSPVPSLKDDEPEFKDEKVEEAMAILQAEEEAEEAEAKKLAEAANMPPPPVLAPAAMTVPPPPTLAPPSEVPTPVQEKKTVEATVVKTLPRSSLDDILDIVAASPHAVDEYWQANWEPKGVTRPKVEKPRANGRAPWGSRKKEMVEEPLPQLFGHDPNEKIPEDACLLGCVFFITEYSKYDEVNAWKEIIAQNGGIVVYDYSNRVTHLLCETQRTDMFAMALKDGKRVVTAHWLNDCLERRRMLPPWRALHLPSVYGDNKPCANQIICITNYEGCERTRIKHMIKVIGAKYTTYMTHTNSALVCKRPGGMKYEKAKEWRIPTVNGAWLSDLVLGHLDALKIPINVRYTRLGQETDFDIELRKVLRLMVGWRIPLRIPPSTWETYKPRPLKPLNSELSRKRKLADLDLDGEEKAAKRARLTPTFDENTAPSESDVTDPSRPRVMMTGYSVQMTNNLTKLVKILGGTVTQKSSQVTHLVADKFVRTMKFFSTISRCRHVVTAAWLEESARRGDFVAEEQFSLSDTPGERELGISLAGSLRRARVRPVFSDMRFYISPCTPPGLGALREVVENAGGTLVHKRPPAREIAAYKTPAGVPTFIVVGCENDLHILRDLYDKRIPVYNAEFILTGALKQTIEFDQNLLTFAA